MFCPEDYPDDLPDAVPLRSEAIKGIIRGYPLHFYPERDPRAEKKQLPAFVKALHGYISVRKTIPTQVDYYAYYTEYFASFFAPLQADEALMSGIRARVYRTYPSLVREMVFIKYVKENMPAGVSALYNRQLDVCGGIDLMISVKGHHFAISLYVETKNGKKSREKKQYRHTPFENVAYIDLSAKLSELEKCGDFRLYGTPKFEELKETIKLRYRENKERGSG